MRAGRRALAPVLSHGGQLLRNTSNRYTTWAILRHYNDAPLIERSIYGMTRHLTPADFGPADKTAFIAVNCCEVEVNQFLAGSGRSLTPVELKKFRSGETYVRIQETVRDKNVVLFQDFRDANINDALMQTLLLVNAAKLASAKKVTLMTPALPYMNEEVGSPGHKFDYFKLMLNLLFKGVGLDELRLGPCLLDRQRSFLFLQDKMFSRDIAPYVISHGENMGARQDGVSRKLVYLIGSGYHRSAREIINLLRKEKILGTTLDLQMERASTGKIRMKGGQRYSLLGTTAFIFQTCNTGRVNDDLIESLLMIYAAKKMGAREIVLVMPYKPYDRQERKAQTREPISAKVVANALVEAAGATQIITMDLHAPATQGFVDIPMQHITAAREIADFFREQLDPAGEHIWIIGDPKVGAPDVGRGKAARKLGQDIMGNDYDIVVIDKDRPRAGESRVAWVIGKVRDRDIILFDDMIDSAGTIINGSNALKKRGARRIYVACVHPVFSHVKIKLLDEQGRPIPSAQEELENITRFLEQQGKDFDEYVKLDKQAFTVNALVRLQANPNIDGLVFTDTLTVPEHLIIDRSRIRILPVAPLLANVSARIIQGESLENYQYEAK